MALGVPKIVCGFSNFKYGWSETLYNTTAEDLRALLQKAEDYAKIRRNMLGTTSTLDTIFVEDEANKGPTLSKLVSLSNTSGKYAIGPSDQPYSCFLIKMVAAAATRRMFALSGAADDIIINPPRPPDNPEFKQAFDMWAKELKTNGWAIRCLDKGVTNPTKDISDMLSGVPSTFTAVGFTAAFNSKVRITGVDPASYNGVWTVQSNDGNVFTIKENFAAPLYNSGGKVRLVKYILSPITDVTIEGESSRKRGRNLKAPVGRKRK